MAGSPVSDSALIARVLMDDDRHAFAELVRRYQGVVRAGLRKMTGDEALADDLAQETFLKAYRNLRHYRGDAKFSTWLHRIAYNSFVSHWRVAKPTSELTEDMDGEAESPATDLKMDMTRALAQLSEPERAAIVQCYHNDLTHEEAAFVLGYPLGTVKSHIRRAKEKLKITLAAWEFQT